MKAASKTEVINKVKGSLIVYLEGNELTEYGGFECYRNGAGPGTMYSIFEQPRDIKLLRLPKDEFYEWVAEKVTILGYTLDKVQYV